MLQIIKLAVTPFKASRGHLIGEGLGWNSTPPPHFLVKFQKEKVEKKFKGERNSYINLPRTCGKLHYKGEPKLFSGSRDLSVQTERNNVTFFMDERELLNVINYKFSNFRSGEFIKINMKNITE